MKLLPDGEVYLEKGEPFPFVCPACKQLIEHRETDAVTCPRCQHRGPVDEFSEGFYELVSRIN